MQHIIYTNDKIQQREWDQKFLQTSRKDIAAGSFGRKEIDMRLSFVNSELASI